MPPELVVLVGPAACGKSTFARELKNSYGFRVLAADDFAPDIRDFWRAAEKCHAERVVLDGAFVRRRARLRALSLFPGYRASAYVFSVSPEECLARNRARGKRLPDEKVLHTIALWESVESSEGFAAVYHVRPEK